MPNVSSGKYIVDKIRQGGFAPHEIKSDATLRNIVWQILNEQKIAHVKGFENDGSFWQEGEEGVYQQGETDLLPQDMQTLIFHLLGEQDEFELSPVHFARINKNRAIDGMAPKIKRTIGNDGLISFYPSMPEFEYIYNNILDPDSPEYQQMFDKVILPYVEHLERNGGAVLYDVPPEIKNGMESVFASANMMMPTEGYDIEAMIQYTLHNILNLSNSFEMRDALGNIAKLSFDENSHEDAVKKVFGKIIEKNENPSKKLERILNGVSGQIYMNTYEKDDLDAKTISDKMKRVFKIYTADERGNPNFETDPNGYRKVNVGLSKRDATTRQVVVRDILLHNEDNNIPIAMEKFSAEVAFVMQNADKIPEEEYLKRVAALHFRFITIHPFTDGNGRIGRNIINMMVGQIGRNFVMPKEWKSNEYIQRLDAMRENIFADMAQEELGDSVMSYPEETRSLIGRNRYLSLLVDAPQFLGPYEMRHCEPLMRIIEKSNTIPISGEQRKPQSRKISTEDMEF